MNFTKGVPDPGVPTEVDVSTIERELASFWKSPSAGESGEGAVRACSCNLVSIVRSRDEASQLPATLAKVAEWLPFRSIVAYSGEDSTTTVSDPATQIRAWISAQCTLPSSASNQICCETITLCGRGKAAEDLPNTIISLLVPDLPVYLYWRSFKPEETVMVERLARFAHLLIVDSHQSKEDPHNRERLLTLLQGCRGRIAVRDMNWARLTAWRDLIAQFFDAPSLRHFVREISEVDVTRSLSAAGSIPTRTLLLTGWLASRLDWHLLSTRRAGDRWMSRWNSQGGEVIVTFGGRLSELDQPPGISALTLRTHTGETFSVVREQGSSYLRTTASIRETNLGHSVPDRSLDEASLLLRELSLNGEDADFADALAEALALERSFQTGEVQR